MASVLGLHLPLDSFSSCHHPDYNLSSAVDASTHGIFDSREDRREHDGDMACAWGRDCGAGVTITSCGRTNWRVLQTRTSVSPEASA